jgi:excisionase family DNA binding protein
VFSPARGFTVHIEEEKVPTDTKQSPYSLGIAFSYDPMLTSSPSSLKIEWLDSKEAANLLRVTVKALRNLTSNGNIPFYKLGRRNRYRRDELEAILLQEKRGKHGN